MATTNSDGEEEENDKQENGIADNQDASAPISEAPVDEEDEFAFQLRQEAEERMRQAGTTTQPEVATDGAGPSAADSGVVLSENGSYVYTDPSDGTVYEYDYERKAWIPKVDDDFIARYQAQYGVYDPQQQLELAQQNAEMQGATAPKPAAKPKEQAKEQPPEDLDEEGKKEWMKQRKKEKRKLAADRQRQQANWFDMDESHNTNVYVSGLPPDIELKEFEEIMTKCGILALDPETKKPKLKLYRDEQGNPKGDGLCCYVKKESIELATQILDGYDVRGHKLKVELAHFELKGEYDPAKKRKKLSAKQKKKLRERQEKMFDWRPEKLRGERPKSDCTVIIRRLFTLEELPKIYISLKESFKAQCSKYGDVKKIVFYDNNPEGVAAVTFKTAEQADDCIKMMDYRHFEGKQLRAEVWDGTTKFKLEETEEDRNKRMAHWGNYLEEGPSAGESTQQANDSVTKT